VAMRTLGSMCQSCTHLSDYYFAYQEFCEGHRYVQAVLLAVLHVLLGHNSGNILRNFCLCTPIICMQCGSGLVSTLMKKVHQAFHAADHASHDLRERRINNPIGAQICHQSLLVLSHNSRVIMASPGALLFSHTTG
jgi:hypothetical protein